MGAGAYRQKSNAKEASDAKVEMEADVESAPISLSPSPLYGSGRPTRGATDYFSVPKKSDRDGVEIGLLKVSPTARRGRSASEISGFTSVASSPGGR